MKRLLVRVLVAIVGTTIATVVLIAALLVPIDHKMREIGCKKIIYSGLLLLRQELLRRDPANYETFVAENAPLFDFPMRIVDIPDGVDPNMLATPKLVCEQVPAFPVGTMTVAFPITTTQAIEVGPLKPPPLPFALMIIAVSVMLLIGGVLAIFIVRPLAKRLLNLEQVAARLRDGDLNARVREGGDKALDNLARQINQMAEQLSSQLRQREELLQAVAHEIGTPLARIHFDLEFLEQATEPEVRAQRRARIERNLDELDRLTSELTEWMRLGSEPAQATPETCEVQPLIEATLVDIVLPQRRQVALESQGETELLVCVDPLLFVRALRNLVNNALRYAQTRVDVTVFDEDDSWVYVIVTDDGPGIADEHRERVFEPFVRLDASRSRSSGGRGLGLAIVHRIVRQHGGTIEVDPNWDGTGTRFVTRWPALR